VKSSYLRNAQIGNACRRKLSGSPVSLSPLDFGITNTICCVRSSSLRRQITRRQDIFLPNFISKTRVISLVYMILPRNFLITFSDRSVKWKKSESQHVVFHMLST
jgi:hypothetical protein